MRSVLALLLFAAAAGAADFEAGVDLEVDGRPWLRTVITPFDPANAEATYKVFTHIYDFEGEHPITKGAGGKFTHHRGLFIGWKDTLVDGVDFDTWHMPNCYQQFDGWETRESGAAEATQSFRVRWAARDGKDFIHELRTIRARPGAEGERIIDFTSRLTALNTEIPLKGDLQHAGMQLRLANEVSEHEETTSYILPAGAQAGEDDAVTGAWWACVSAEVLGQRYWIIHMTPPSHPSGVPVYSIRKYARFGAFWEPVLAKGEPYECTFRMVVSAKELDQAACQAHYDAYAGAAK